MCVYFFLGQRRTERISAMVCLQATGSLCAPLQGLLRRAVNGSRGVCLLPPACAARGIRGSNAVEESAAVHNGNVRSGLPSSRRLVLCIFLSAFVANESAQARERRDRRAIPLEDYQASGDGLKFYDLVVGKGAIAGNGKTVVVHFDCVYGSITVVSSRQSKLLGGNRIIAQPYELVVGSVPGKERKREFVDNANGLFSAQAAPKPPAALYSIVEGMRVGGKRTVRVPPEVGYGQKGLNEIPPGATFDLNVELLEVRSA